MSLLEEIFLYLIWNQCNKVITMEQLNEWIAVLMFILFIAAYCVPILAFDYDSYWKQYLMSLGCILLGIGFLIMLFCVAATFMYLMTFRFYHAPT